MGKVILAGPFTGEFGWEVLRFAPYVLWNKIKKHKSKVRLIILTRPDRFDLYGERADILEPLYLKEEGRIQDCFRLTGLHKSEYHNIAKSFYKKYYGKYNIVDHIYPEIENKQYLKKNQYLPMKMYYDFKPREENKKLINNYILDDKPLVVIAPRFRKGIKRNWKNWEELYHLIDKNEFLKNFSFIICGKKPDYIIDPKNRFYDINNVSLNNKTSLIGVTMEAIKKSVLTVGSQSGIPNLSLMLQTEVLEWGNEKRYHTRVYNPKKTKIKFLEDHKYEISAKEILEEMILILKKEKIKND